MPERKKGGKYITELVKSRGGRTYERYFRDSNGNRISREVLESSRAEEDPRGYLTNACEKLGLSREGLTRAETRVILLGAFDD